MLDFFLLFFVLPFSFFLGGGGGVLLFIVIGISYLDELSIKKLYVLEAKFLFYVIDLLRLL